MCVVGRLPACPPSLASVRVPLPPAFSLHQVLCAPFALPRPTFYTWRMSAGSAASGMLISPTITLTHPDDIRNTQISVHLAWIHHRWLLLDCNGMTTVRAPNVGLL